MSINFLKETMQKAGCKSPDELAERIEWAKIKFVSGFDHEMIEPIIDTMLLHPSHSNEQAKEFVKKLDFEYDNGYGFQEIDGTVMLKNGEWLNRREYDGAEWWQKLHIPSFIEV